MARGWLRCRGLRLLSSPWGSAECCMHRWSLAPDWLWHTLLDMLPLTTASVTLDAPISGLPRDGQNCPDEVL
eukprot:3270364-Alexandrium_andersonii.AAC.1